MLVYTDYQSVIRCTACKGSLYLEGAAMTYSTLGQYIRASVNLHHMYTWAHKQL